METYPGTGHSDFRIHLGLVTRKACAVCAEAVRPDIEVCYNVEGTWMRRDQPAGMQLTSELKS